MPISREYLVSFNKAEKQTWGGYAITFDIGTRSENHTVSAATLPDLEQQVRRLALAFGATCSPYVRMPKGARKPGGFDAWTKTINIIEHVPEPSNVVAMIDEPPPVPSDTTTSDATTSHERLVTCGRDATDSAA